MGGIKIIWEKWLKRWIFNPGVPCSKPLSGSEVDSAFNLSEVDKMSARNVWELKVNCLFEVAAAFRQLDPIP